MPSLFEAVAEVAETRQLAGTRADNDAVELPFALIALALLAIPFVLPIISWVAMRGLRVELGALREEIEQQQSQIERLTAGLALVDKRTQVPPVSQPATGVHTAEPSAPVPPTPPTAARPHVALPTPQVAPPPPIAPLTPQAAPPPPPSATPPPMRPSSSGVPPRPPAAETPRPPPERTSPPRPQPQPTPQPAPASVAAAFRIPAFDWEQLVGVRLFSGIAGIALVLAGVFFLRYSIDHGWLQPPVRVAIGTLVGIALLVVCELKAARRYPVTANALDAAAIAILFSTFFSAHASWDLIPATVTFGLLALVTATAVALSIRRDSLFIAVLGLLGGFATPALLSSGQNQPIGLFSYLMVLNIGLAWVAWRKRWPVLSALSLVLTTLYQWGWVIKFLDASQLPLAIGIFIVFAAVGFAALVVSSAAEDRNGGLVPPGVLDKLAVGAAGMPLLFAIHLAAVPAYGDRFWLLFGFLLMIDVGLFAIAVKRRQSLTHVIGAVLTLLIFGVWLGVSYPSTSWPFILPIAVIFVALYLFASPLARRIGGAFDQLGEHTALAAPVLLFTFVALARIEPRAAAPLVLFGTLLVVLIAIAWQAIARGRGLLYYVAAFFAVSAQAMWSVGHLRVERLTEAMLMYAAFGIASLAVPVIARRAGRPLGPDGAPGAVTLASLALLLFITSGPITPAALWGLTLLLAILNAGVFIESAAVGVPLLSLVASAGSWILMAHWWFRSAGAIGVLPSLFVLVLLTLIMLAGYSWARHASPSSADKDGANFRHGFNLALAGHLFLFAFATQAQWSLPPWPLFGALSVMTLALLASALAFRDPRLHIGTLVAAAMVVVGFASAASSAPWPSVAVGAFAAVSGVALAWIFIARRAGFEFEAATVSAVTIGLGSLGAIVADSHAGAPPLWVLLPWHAAAASLLLWLATRYQWARVAPGAAVLSGIAVLFWSLRHHAAADWSALLVFASVLYAVFAAYPLLLGGRGRDTRDPYVAAILASVWAFFAARHAFELGDLMHVVGIVPVTLGAVMALHVRELLRIQTAAQRDLGRLALVAAAALAFVTIAIPLQLDEQWITIGWALEGAALTWLYYRVPHRGLLYGATALLAATFIRLALNPEVFVYEPRGAVRVFNWYLYTYVIAAAAMFFATWRLSRTNDVLVEKLPRVRDLAAAAGTILLFVLLNIEIADFYATGPEIVFRFGVSIAQDLTYTIAWLLFGLGMLAAGIALASRSARIAAVAMIAATTLKCFLYDLSSLEGLYRVGAFVGLAASLTLVSLALQKFILKPREHAA